MSRIRFPKSLLLSAAAVAALGCARAPVAGASAAVVAKPAAVPAVPGPEAQANSAPLQLTLPAPSGPDRLGVVSLHLIDHARTDPWVPGHQARQIMISIWYPATNTARYPLQPWLEPAAAAHFEQGLHTSAALIRLPVTAGHKDAPVDRHAGVRPVVLYSPGSGADRTADTALVEDLASYGYIVVTIDHTHDAGEVQFPDGHLEVRTVPPDSDQVNTEATAVRVADTRFVLDQLAAINAGHDPDAEHRPLPRGLAGALNLHEVGMFGHSMGGATAANAMLDDPRIRAGINLDGTIWGPAAAKGLDRPFLLISAQDNGRDVDPSWASFWAHLRGWRLDLRLTGAEHLSFTDAVTLYHQAARILHLSPAQVAQLVGTINGDRAITIERTYVRAFFDLQLRHRDTRLLDHPSPAYPEMQYIP